jgi:hypothetical protein
MKNKVISPLTMLVDVSRDENGRAGFDAGSSSTALGIAKMANRGSSSDDCSLSLEAYLRKMISKCAVNIYIPRSVESGPKKSHSSY